MIMEKSVKILNYHKVKVTVLRVLVLNALLLSAIPLTAKQISSKIDRSHTHTINILNDLIEKGVLTVSSPAYSKTYSIVGVK